ncbi:hypothetical protein V8E55_009575 [Tylopilus felleus]
MFNSIFDSDDSNTKSWSDPPSSKSSTTLEYVINQVFRPVYYQPHEDHYTRKNAYALARAAHAAARAYDECVDNAHKSHWSHITKMLDNLQVAIGAAHRSNGEYRDHVIFQLSRMNAGGMFRCSSLIFLLRMHRYPCISSSISRSDLWDHISEARPPYSVRATSFVRRPCRGGEDDKLISCASCRDSQSRI